MIINIPAFCKGSPLRLVRVTAWEKITLYALRSRTEAMQVSAFMRLQRDNGFIPSRVERLYVVVLECDLQNLIQVQDGFVCVAHLEQLIDHPCETLFARKHFFCAASCWTVDDLLETTTVLVTRT